MKDRQESYEEYVKPPSYTESNGTGGKSDDPLITKLRTRIQKDLNQINGVYDSRIKESEEKKKKMMLLIDQEHKDIVATINKQRTKDIETYNETAERHIDNLISTMHNSPQTIVLGWWDNISKMMGL